MRIGVRNAQSFNFGTGGRNDIDLVLRGQELVARARCLVRLNNPKKVEHNASPPQIDLLDSERQVSVRASVAPGYALADRIEALRKEVKEMNLPSAYTTHISGRA